jgi:hypothetical protein
LRGGLTEAGRGRGVALSRISVRGRLLRSLPLVPAAGIGLGEIPRSTGQARSTITQAPVCQCSGSH